MIGRYREKLSSGQEQSGVDLVHPPGATILGVILITASQLLISQA